METNIVLSAEYGTITNDTTGEIENTYTKIRYLTDEHRVEDTGRRKFNGYTVHEDTGPGDLFSSFELGAGVYRMEFSTRTEQNRNGKTRRVMRVSRAELVRELDLSELFEAVELAK